MPDIWFAVLKKHIMQPGIAITLIGLKNGTTGSGGGNIKNIPLIDKDLACYDALTPEGVNLNQGAESNICFLMAYLAAKRLNLRQVNP